MTPAELFTRTAHDMRILAAGTVVTPWPPDGIYLDVEVDVLSRTAEHVAAWSPEVAATFAAFLTDLARMFDRWPGDTQQSLVHPGLVGLCEAWWKARGIDPETLG